MFALKLFKRVASLHQIRSGYVPSWVCLLTKSNERCASGGPDPDWDHPERHQNNQEGNGFSSSSSTSSDKRTSRPPEFRHRRKRLKIQHSPYGDELQRLCEEGQLDKALDVLSRTDQQGPVPPVSVYCSLLRACTKRKALAQARCLHAHLAKQRLESTKFLGEFVLSTLVKCGGLEEAITLFYRLKHRTAVSWTALISGYTMAGRGQEALRIYQCMLAEGVEPDKCTFISVLRACGSLGDLKEARRLHGEAVKYGCWSDFFVGACLVDMYSKCRSIVDAQNVFDSLPHRNVVSWTAMLWAYVKQGQPKKALQLYEQMREEHVSPNNRTFVFVLQACGELAEKDEYVVNGLSSKRKFLDMGRAIHADARKAGYDSDVFVGNTLISMYGKCGSIVESQDVFDKLSSRDIVSWNAMLTAYVEQGPEEEALQLYNLMKENGVKPDVRTFVRVLQACAVLAEKEDHGIANGQATKLESLKLGQAIHADVLGSGFESDIFIGSTLITMYGKCGSIADAQKVFGGLSQRNVVSWTAMLGAYAQQGKAEMALDMYEQMQAKGVSPNDRTLVSALQACGILAEEEDDVMDGLYIKMKSLERTKAIHVDAGRKGYISDVFVGSTLISVYGKCGSIVDALEVFEGLPQRNVVSWNAMLAAYAQQGQAEKAFQLYEQMQSEGVMATEITLMCILQACGCAGGLDVCRHIHHKIISSRKVLSTVLANTLIHAYGRCASMVDAQKVFEEMKQPNVVSWNALISGYARQGNTTASLRAYDKMHLVGMKPNGLTLLSVLSACSHAGLVHKGVEYFESMSRHHGMNPEIEHYVCIVDLLGRAGHFRLIEDLLSTIPVQPNLTLWLCLLSSCRKHGKVVLGKVAFDCAVRLQPRHAASYVLMSNIYVHAGLLDSEKEVNQLEQKAGAWKKCGQSWIDHEQDSHTFLVGDDKHPQQRHVYDMLKQVRLELQEEHSSPDMQGFVSKVPTDCVNFLYSKQRRQLMDLSLFEGSLDTKESEFSCSTAKKKCQTVRNGPD